MKKLLLASAVALTATSASAIDLGYGLKAGGEIDINYVTGIEDWSMDFTPSVGVEKYGVEFTVDTTIDLLALDTDEDIFTGLDLKAEYAVTSMLTTYGEISSDKDFEFGDITIGAVISF